MIEVICLAAAFILGMLFQNFLMHGLIRQLQEDTASEKIEREDEDNWWKNGETPPWEQKTNW